MTASNPFVSPRDSLGIETMESTPRGSSEVLQTESPTSPSRGQPPRLSTLIGPPGMGGLQFPHSHTHDPEQSVDQTDASAEIRKKFKKAVDNVRAVQRIQSGSGLYTGGVAAEPGLDYTTMDVEGFNAPAEVTVIDYSARRCMTSKKMKMLSDFQEFFQYDRPAWSKVRWINVDGLNWPCIKLLAMKYKLHRLAIEDLLSVQRTKIDLYQDHTYVCLLLHVLIGEGERIVVDDEDSASVLSWIEDQRPTETSFWSKLKNLLKGTSQNDALLRDAETAAGVDQPQKLSVTPIAQHYHPDRSLIHNQINSMRSSNLTVAVEQVSIFLTNDGTVITFFQQSGRAVEKPIAQRLGSESTILRTSEDPSLLLQSIIDAVVDLSFPIATAYQELIADLEIDVLTNPQMAHTRELHIVSGELNILKRTLYPLHNMINALRDHRSNKRTGYFNAGYGSSAPTTPQPSNTGSMATEYEQRGADISAAARIYLADVADHVLILTEEVDMLRGTVENMINMIFNMVASTQNESMRQLTMASLIFLPLTFITGYFGMNFNTDHWPELVDNGPLFFWKIAIPATVAVMVILMYTYITRLLKTLNRQVVRKGVKIRLRRNRELRRHRGTGGVTRVDTTSKKLPVTT